MRSQNFRNIVISFGIILILGAILYFLIRNYILLAPLDHEVDYTLINIIECENFFWYLSLGFIGIGLYCILSQLKLFNLKKNIVVLISLFLLSIITFFALLKINSMVGLDAFTEYYQEYISYLIIILSFNTLSFFGVILGILAQYTTD